MVDFYFDVGSPAAYLAWTQLPALCEATEASLVYKPMLLGGVFQAIGNASPAAVPAKGRHYARDYARHAVRYGVPFRHNPHFPINTLFLMRAVTGVQLHEPARLQSFLAAVFAGLWVDGLDLNDAALSAGMLAAAGFEPGRIQALAAEPAVKAALRATTDEAVARGVFGAPSIFVGDEMFFGQDRMDMVRDEIVRLRRHL